ncbi:Lysophospholipid acyltransferase LPEAT1 [Linum perenne]
METELNDVNSVPSKAHATTTTCSSSDDLPFFKSDSSSGRIISSDSLDELSKKCAAFARHDVYGPLGCGELPFAEKLLLGLACVTLLPIRFVLAFSILFFYYLVCKICTLFSKPNRDEEAEEQEDFVHMGGWRRAVIVCFGRFLARLVLFVFGFYWINESYRDLEQDQTGGRNQSQPPERPGAIVSNHVSYVDILYHMSSSFTSFVAKRSVAKLPLIGLVSKCLGCVFVQRESRSSDFKGVAGIVTERIKEAQENEYAPMMMLFPEGTTTNGDFLLPFKTGGFLAGAPVIPVILRYPYQRFSVAWDSISGVRHVILLLCQIVNYLEVIRLPVYYPSQEEKDDPKLYADNIRRLMAREGNLVMSDIGLAEKRVYIAALNRLPTNDLHEKDD